MASFRFPGSQCRYRLLDEIDSGTLARSVSRCPGQAGNLSFWGPGFLPAALVVSSAITDTDKAEFSTVKKMPVMDSKHHLYGSVNHYVSDRSLYFGPPTAYATFAADSDDELAKTKWEGKKGTRTLRSMIEFTNDARKQQIFYRWVRKAYKRKYGDNVDVTELIHKGMSKELEEKIKEVRGTIRVKKIHDEQFHTGGFNPRPIKFGHHYVLGTLSEHATGLAVDIDDSQNAQLTAEEWKFIEDLVGKHISRSGRWKTEDDAEKLWKDIAEISELFVKKVAAEVKRIEQERVEKEKTAAPHLAAKAKHVQTPLHEVLGKHFNSLSPWVTTGFFHLPLDLVLELHAHGFTWGAAFNSNADLHHFQLDK